MALIGKKLSRLSYKLLYPFTGMDTDGTFDVSGTYCYWNGEENIDNLQLIAHYKHINNNLYTIFEKNFILKNKLVTHCYKVEDGTVYIYDLIDSPDEVFHFINGSYSQLTSKSKAKILKFNNVSNNVSVESENILHMYLYPDKYYSRIANELEVDIREVKNKELGKKFDKDKETLDINIIKNGLCVPEKIIYY